METINFEKLLLKTGFCCMVSDGDIDQREINAIKTLCNESRIFKDADYESDINALIEEVNRDYKKFIINYFTELENATLSTQEEIDLIGFAVEVIKSDEKIEYSEIKFFKQIRHCLTIEKDEILKNYPDIEDWLEEDIKTESLMEKIKGQYLESFVLPEFSKIDLTTDE